MGMHTSKQFEEDLAELKNRLLYMGSLVEEMIRQVVIALMDRNSEIANKVIDDDKLIDDLEKEIDEMCLRTIALRQPTAGDLRFITSTMKLVTDLERIADIAVNIAERVLELNLEPQLKPYIDLPNMAAMVEKMVKESLDAVVKEDVASAIAIRKQDKDIDQLYQQIFRELLTFMMENPLTITRAMRLIFVAKSFERIADHATNIAEQVLFLVRGKDVRHTEVID
jgi:phosphate transport system protein